jgi:hypothetical protein
VTFSFSAGVSIVNVSPLSPRVRSYVPDAVTRGELRPLRDPTDSGA